MIQVARLFIKRHHDTFFCHEIKQKTICSKLFGNNNKILKYENLPQKPHAFIICIKKISLNYLK